MWLNRGADSNTFKGNIALRKNSAALLAGPALIVFGGNGLVHSAINCNRQSGCISFLPHSAAYKHTMAHAWFEPLYRRILTLAASVGWLIFELFQQEPLWLLLAAAFTAYAVWAFFLSSNYRK